VAEYEITRLLKLQDAMAKHLDVPEPDSAELPELEQDVEPEVVLEKLESTGAGSSSASKHEKSHRHQNRQRQRKCSHGKSHPGKA
jgi:hypothetical protein